MNKSHLDGTGHLPDTHRPQRENLMPYGIIGLLHLILWLIAAFEILNSGKDVGYKVLWLLIILLLPFLGLVLYFLLARGK